MAAPLVLQPPWPLAPGSGHEAPHTSHAEEKPLLSQARLGVQVGEPAASLLPAGSPPRCTLTEADSPPSPAAGVEVHSVPGLLEGLRHTSGDHGSLLQERALPGLLLRQREGGHHTLRQKALVSPALTAGHSEVSRRRPPWAELHPVDGTCRRKPPPRGSNPSCSWRRLFIPGRGDGG